MILLIAIISLLALMALHEFGHFIVAKLFGIKVEEFGIGYPPRIFAKKFGKTLYSLNWLPFGAFVKIYGHEKRILDDKASFSSRPVWQRASVILGGVVSFWIVAAVLLSFVMALGMPSIITDSETEGLVNPRVQIIEISKNSVAQKSGLKVGDAIREIKSDNDWIKIEKVKQAQEIIISNKGKEIVLKIERAGSLTDISAVPNKNPEPGQGALGVGLVRTALISYPWYEAPFKGIVATKNITLSVFEGWWGIITGLFKGTGIPQGVEFYGVVGIFDLFVQAGKMGVIYFLQFISVISVSLAVLNILPIPALDGGWLALLIIEKIKGKPIKEKTEQVINTFFFLLLITLMVFITIKDIIRIF